MPRVARFEASPRARIASPPTETSVLVLWLNQVTRRFCGELPQTPQTRCSLYAKLLLTWPPRRPGSVLLLGQANKPLCSALWSKLRNPTVFWWTVENPACKAQPHLAKHRARQAFHLWLPDGLLGVAPFNNLATTLHRLRVHEFVLLFLPPYGSHLISSATVSLEPSLLVSPLLGGHRHRPFAIVLHLHHTNQAAACTCNTRQSQSTQRCQLLIMSALTTHH
jgi:hypothetical protein